MRLNEIINRQLDLGHLKPWMYRTKEEVEHWMEVNSIGEFVNPTNLMIHSSFMIGLTENSFVNYQGKKCLPVCFDSTEIFFGEGIGIENFYKISFILFRCSKY